jgi:hypothetical protein
MLDKEQWGVDDLWEIMELKEGKYFGDCESYVLTLIAKVDGFKDLEPYYLARLQGTEIIGHCVGKLGDKWIDCNYQMLTDKNTVCGAYSTSRPMGTFEVWWNIQKSKLFKATYKHFPKVAVSVTNFLK